MSEEQEISGRTATQIVDDVVKDLTEFMRGSVGFVKSEVPDVARQVVRFWIVSSLIWFVCGLAILGVSIYLTAQTHVWAQANLVSSESWRGGIEKSWGWEYIALQIGSVGGVIVGLVACYQRGNDLIEALTAPKRLVIRYLKGLIS